MKLKTAIAVAGIAALMAAPASQAKTGKPKCFKTAGFKVWTDEDHNAYMKYDMLSVWTSIYTRIEVYHDGTLEYSTDVTDTENYGLVSHTASQNLPMSWKGDKIKIVVTNRANGCTRKLTGTVPAP